MPHLEDGRLHELLDGELDPAAVGEIEAHLRGCPECARRLQEARTFLTEADGLVRKLDPPVISGLPRPSPGAGLPPLAARSRLLRYRKLAWAASIVLATGLGFSASELWHRSQSTGATALDTTYRESMNGRGNAAPAAGPTALEAPAVETKPVERGQTTRQNKVSIASRDSLNGQETAAPASSRLEPGPESAVDRFGAAMRTLPEARSGVADKAEWRKDAEADRESDLRAAQDAAASPINAAAAPVPAAPVAGGGAAANEENQARAESNVRAQPLPAGRRTAIRPSAVGLVDGLSQHLRAPAPGFRRIGMEEAVRQLSGAIRLIDGAAPEQVQFGPGAGPTDFVVRVVYADPPSREIWLDQQRITGQLAGPGDTAAVALTGGGVRLGWQDASGFRLALTGNLTADSLKSLAHRIR